MSKKNNWIWLTYFIIYSFLSILNLLYFFSPDSPVGLYYNIAMAFNFHFFGIYFFNFISVLLNVLTIFPLYLYTFNINFIDPRFWACFLILRLAFDVMGHNYDLNVIKSLYYENHILGIKTLIATVVLSIPSYMALFEYAFRKVK